ncbi:hypothetical protein [Streptomyces olivaceoviridis]|uniref:hypothetical protein n=1 Tax=Streptomyces olivaceoviridis TaxID=1921 RepID=UPI0036FCAB7E
MSLLDAHTAEVPGISRGACPGLVGTAVDARQARRPHRRVRHPAGPRPARLVDRTAAGTWHVPPGHLLPRAVRSGRTGLRADGRTHAPVRAAVSVRRGRCRRSPGLAAARTPRHSR